MARLGEIDVSRLEQAIAVLPEDVRFNLGGALERPMCPASFGAQRGGLGEDEDEVDAGASGRHGNGAKAGQAGREEGSDAQGVGKVGALHAPLFPEDPLFRTLGLA